MTNPARAFFTHLSSGNLEAAMALTTADFTWTVEGKQGGPFHLAGRYDRDSYIDMTSGMSGIFERGPEIEITSDIDGGDHIAIEAHVTGRNVAGTAYDNRLVYVFDVQDGKLRAAREYLDTAHAAEVFSATSQ